MLNNFNDPEKIKARTEIKLKIEKPILEVEPKPVKMQPVKESVAKFLHLKEKEQRNHSLLPTIKEDTELCPQTTRLLE